MRGRAVYFVTPSDNPAGGAGVIDMELTARGGGSMRIRIDKATGGLID